MTISVPAPKLILVLGHFIVTIGTFSLALVALDPTVTVALIGAAASVISSSIWGWTNRSKIVKVEQHVDGMNTQLRQQRNDANTRADISEGKASGKAEARTEAKEDKS